MGRQIDDQISIWDRSSLLLSPGFVVSLALLIVNDHFIKAYSPGLVSGKLSDFAGLFAFSFFVATVLPRVAKASYALIAIAFVAWKTNVSTYAVERWNDLGLVQFGRVLDVTDLLALSILPLSFFYWRRAIGSALLPNPRRLPSLVIAVVAVVAFTATSRHYSREINYKPKGANVFLVDMPKEAVVDRINGLEPDCDPDTLSSTTSGVERVDVRLPYHNSCEQSFEVSFQLTPVDSGTEIALLRVEYSGWQPPGGKKALRQEFREQLVDRLLDDGSGG